MEILDVSELLYFAVCWNCLDEAHQILERPTIVNSICVYLITKNINPYDHLSPDLSFLN